MNECLCVRAYHYTNNEESSFFCHIFQSIPQDFHARLLQQVGLSSDPGQGVIIAARDYERQFSAHLVRSFKWNGMTYQSSSYSVASI